MATLHSGLLSLLLVKKTVSVLHLPYISACISTGCWCKNVERRKKPLHLLERVVLSIVVAAPLEISGHNVMLSVWPLIQRKKKNTQLPKWNQRCSAHHQQLFCNSMRCFFLFLAALHVLHLHRVVTELIYFIKHL